nr:helix-turn-helix domain-containing protein [Micromonospora sp. DSM 115978]
MIAPARRTAGDLPVGRRVARLRTRLGMTQEVFAGRIGKSKSWVDKVERGLRRLDRLSVIETVTQVLGVTPEVLLTNPARPEPPTGLAAAIERVRAALACYDTPDPRLAPPPDELHRRVEHAWVAYRHAHHPQLLKLLPDLLRDARHAAPGSIVDPLLRTYRLTAQVLIKLGEPHLAWLAADRAMATATGDPRRTAIAAIPLTQALRALHRGHLAMAAALTAVHQLKPADSPLAGILLVEAALAAAAYGDPATARDLTARAATHTTGYADQPHRGSTTAFGPTVVDLARALIAAHLGDSQLAVATHQRATSTDGWGRLPAEHRAAHLIDMVRAHLDVGDPDSAGRALVTADQIAIAETRARPTARAALIAVLRAGPTAADVTHLATAIGLTTPP